MPYPIADLIDLIRWQAARRERPPVGTPSARVEILTARGKRVPAPTKRGGQVQACRRMTHQEQSDEHRG